MTGKKKLPIFPRLSYKNTICNSTGSDIPFGVCDGAVRRNVFIAFNMMYTIIVPVRGRGFGFVYYPGDMAYDFLRFPI